MKLIIGCRHGESYKNLKDIYGGKGGALTEKGKNQVDELGKKINIICEQTGLPVIFYASCERVQIIETAHILLKKFNQNKLNFSKKFSPIRLGVFDGMSRDKQLELYPDACRAHQQWKNGEIDIKQSENCVEGKRCAR